MELPDLVPRAGVLALADHLLAALGVESLGGAPSRRVIHTSNDSLALQWELSVWGRPPYELRLGKPLPPNRELALEIADDHSRIRLVGPPEGLVSYRVEGDGAWLAAGEAALASFWDVRLKPLSIPSLPRKWRRMGSRPGAVSRARYRTLAPGVDVLLSDVGPGKRCIGFSVLGAGDPVPVSVLGPVGCSVPHPAPRRWLLELEEGRPISPLSGLVPEDTPFRPPHPVEGEREETDRAFTPKDAFGLLAGRTGAHGREILRLSLWREEMLREARVMTGSPNETAAHDPADAQAPWTVEWAMQGNDNYLRGHPGGDENLFARSDPPAAGCRRHFEVYAHGLDRTEDRWLRSLEARGLRCVASEPLL